MRAPWLLAPLLLLAPTLAGAMAEPSEAVIVQFTRPPTPEEKLLLAAHGIHRLVEVVPAGVGDVTPPQRAWLRSRPWVQRIEPDEALRPTLDLSARLVRAGAPTLDLGFDGEGVTIAVLDSGIDTTHPDFQGRVLANVVYANGDWRPTHADLDGHGTHVAGVAAGSGAASGGALRGVAPGADLVGMDFSRAFTTATALQAFDWVLRNARDLHIRVVTNSWGRSESPNFWDPADSLVRASNRLVAEGIVVIFSAGNHGPSEGSVSLEAQNPNVIAVGAVDDAGVPARFSGRGPVTDPSGRTLEWVKPDLVAGGVAVLAPRSGQATGPIEPPQFQPAQLPLPLDQGVGEEPLRYVELSGTSQAAPHVAGIAAIMLQANPSLTPGQVHNVLRETAIDLGAAGPDPLTGFGLVDARDAVRRALELEEDHGNILLAGGEETYAAQGSLASASGQLVQTSPVLQVKPAGAVDAAFPVKVGATAARFDFAWRPATSSFRVYLVGPLQTLGPWTNARLEGGERVVSGFVDRPEPGVYHLVARPVAPVQAEYRSTVTVTIREQARLPAELEQRYRAPEEMGPLDHIASELQFEVDKLAAEFRRAVPGPELALAAVAVLAAAVVGRRRR